MGSRFWFCQFVGLVLVAGVRATQAAAVSDPVPVPAVCQSGCRAVSVTDAGARPNDGKDDAVALNQLLGRHNRNAIIHFPAGTYDFNAAIRRDNLQNVLFRGAPGAVLRKKRPFKEEYLIYSRFSRQVGVKGLQLQGLTTARNAYDWGESGIYLASSHGVLIENNRFADFGDAAIRITTSPAGKGGVASSHSVVRNNRFENVSQISTTSNHDGFGGTAGYLLDNNDFSNLKGSVKFATRMPGAGRIVLRNNRIAGVTGIPTSVGVEIAGYSDVRVENNRIRDCGGFGMNIYTNGGKGIPGFDWGNYQITGNRIENCARGIRISPSAYKTGYVPTVSNVTVQNNLINVRDPKWKVRVTNGQLRNANIQR